MASMWTTASKTNSGSTLDAEETEVFPVVSTGIFQAAHENFSMPLQLEVNGAHLKGAGNKFWLEKKPCRT